MINAFRLIIQYIIQKMAEQGYEPLCQGIDICYQDESGRVLAYSTNIDKEEATITDTKGNYLYIRELSSKYKSNWSAQNLFGACDNSTLFSNSFRMVYVATQSDLDDLNLANAVWNAFMSIDFPEIDNIGAIEWIIVATNPNFKEVFEEETKEMPKSQNLSCVYIDFDLSFVAVACNLEKLPIC